METDLYVLIVDDDEDARTLLAKILATLKIPTRLAANGLDALKLVDAAKPALILLDLMMPGMNGFEVLFRLKARPETRYIPVVVISAVSQNDYLKLPGVDRVIRKANMRVADVQMMVSELIKDLSRAASAPQPNNAELDRLTHMSHDASSGAIKTERGSLVL